MVAASHMGRKRNCTMFFLLSVGVGQLADTPLTQVPYAAYSAYVRRDPDGRACIRQDPSVRVIHWDPISYHLLVGVPLLVVAVEVGVNVRVLTGEVWVSWLMLGDGGRPSAEAASRVDHPCRS